MSKRCPDCGHVNEDSRIFCSACGEPLNADLRLIQDLEKQKKVPPKEAPAPRRRDDDDDYIPPKAAQKEKKSPLPWIILGLVAVAAVAVWVFFPH